MFNKNKKAEPGVMDIVTQPENIKRIAQELSTVFTVFGDPSRLHILPSAGMVNTLFNTSCGEIFIGEHTFTGHNVSVITGTHDITKTRGERMTGIPENGRDIVIGNGVWIASGAIILGPCKIDDDAVIAAGSVVLPGTHVGEKEVYAGIPAVYKKTLKTGETL